MKDWGPYTRVYHLIVRDERFRNVYRDDRALAAWLRLLIAADQAWPSPAALPRWLSDKALAILTDAGIVLLEGDYYRIHALDEERSARKQTASAAAAMRWDASAMQTHSESTASASGVRMPNRTEPNREEPNRTDARASEVDDDGRADLEAWLLVRRRPPTERQRAFLDSYIATFDVTGIGRAERLILEHPDDPIGAMKADLDAFRAERLDAARRAEAPKPRAPRGFTGVNAEIAAALREREEVVPVCECGHTKVPAGGGRYVCTNAPGHARTVEVTA